ncbi:hypothetical protein [Diaminobutyricibacter sp. McL0608]|uniref:hypothetical protein n=1 Tax=Leifsonia sp. McL0608 TaxID=3143537 RepID=UPI0031F304F2
MGQAAQAVNEGAIPSWEDLTEAEQLVLDESFEYEPLWVVLNGWVTNEDAPYWNRKQKYVTELAEAARHLVELGLIEVYETRESDTVDDILLQQQEALDVVLDHDNWWSYDSEANWDPAEDTSVYDIGPASAQSPTRIYALYGTPSGNQVSIMRKLWPPMSSVSVRSLGSTGAVDVSRRFEFPSEPK